MTILLFLFVLFILILVHEVGHFIVAKKTGMRVDEFGIGFPPKLYGIKVGETEYTLNALPLGGFVKIYGEDSEDVESDNQRARAFGARPKLAQALVLIAGVTMNVLFAWFLFSIVFFVGVPTAIEEKNASEESFLMVTEVVSGGPAENAGIPVGAKIESLRVGEDIDNLLYPSSFSAFIESHPAAEVEVTYSLGKATFSANLTPVAGVIETDIERPAVGIALALIETVSMPIHIAVYEAGVTTVRSLGAITVGLSSLIYDSVRGQADFSQVAGPIGIVGLVGDAAEFGLASLLMFTAFISLNLAVINLLPFPALDGGRLVFVAIETVTRRQINPVWAGRANFVGFMLLILLMVAVTYNDILRIL